MPFVPVLPGVDTFKGQQMHSHDYRVPSIFKGKRVLVIGAGPSGMDLTLEISREAASASKQTRWFPDVIGSPARRRRRRTAHVSRVGRWHMTSQPARCFPTDSNQSARLIIRVTFQVVMSHHWPEPINTPFPENVRMTSDVETIRGNTVHFKGGTTFEADCLFYCTG